jgi:hypothetical protein
VEDAGHLKQQACRNSKAITYNNMLVTCHFTV